MEIVSSTFFYIIATLAIFGALGVIFAHKIVYALIYAFLTFLCVGFIFVSLEFPLLATSVITLFVACSLVLLTVALMMTKPNKDEGIAFRPRLLLSIFSLVFIIFITVIFVKYGVFFNEQIKTFGEALIMPSSQTISVEMFVNYGAAFIFTALAFLAGIIGFGVFAQPVRRGKK